MKQAAKRKRVADSVEHRGKAGLWLGIAALLILGCLVFAFWPRKGVPPKAIPPKPPVPAPTALSFPKGQGKIAIVLDDWGYSLHQLPALKRIHRPLTIAVLPSLPYSGRIAEEAQAQGYEVILHLPMEAMDPGAPRETETILTGMPSQQVQKILQGSLKTVPFAKGINNHQGSKATADRALMEAVLNEVKRRNFYFLDSRVTESSVCGDVARDLRVRYAGRNVFLDNDKAPEQIRQRLADLARLAAQEGGAIGIGHDRPNTLRVLQEGVPALEKAGYTLVSASELAQ